MRRGDFDLFASETVEYAGQSPAFDFGGREGSVLASAVDDETFEPVAIADTGAIDAARILIDRPDVLASYYTEFYGASNDRGSGAWMNRVGGVTPEDYAKYWYDNHGQAEGYGQGSASLPEDRVAILKHMDGVASPAKATFDGLPLTHILANRPDVLRAYYEGFYGDGNDRHSTAWVKRVGGETAEDYANYWYEKYGRWEGYANNMAAGAEQIDVERLLLDRPDVFRGFYEQFYSRNNDHKSHAWVERVGGDTVQDYAKYWYVTYGQQEGYTQRARPEPPPPEEYEDPQPPWVDPQDPQPEPAPSESEEDGEPMEAGAPVVHDPADDPWNHRDLFPDWRPPFEGWEPPTTAWHAPSEADFFG